MSEPRILFITRKWAPATGGMETYCLKLTEALAAHEPVEVIALPGRADGMPPGPIALLTFPLTVLARYVARGAAPRVLHLGDMAIWPLALPALLWRRTTIVLSSHGTDLSYHRRGGWRGRLYGAYLRLGARVLRSARVIANSQATRAAAQETGWRDIAVVPLATDLSAPDPDGEHEGSLLFAGRLVERKGCGWFVREVLPLLPEHVRLKVAGTMWHAEEAAALDHPRVDYLGALTQRELAGAYGRAMCVIVPNIEVASGEYEGFGLVGCEAAACGGLVLASRTGGLVEAVMDSETGLLLEAGNAEEWRAAILGVLSWSPDRRKQFVGKAQVTAQTRYSWQRVAREVLALYPALTMPIAELPRAVTSSQCQP
jgi:glycosyltransferase involved in cell wall biosynthesis